MPELKGDLRGIKTLKSLEQHERDRQDARAKENQSRPNGIACPACGKELVDVNPNVSLTSHQPQARIGCLSCGYTGYRTA